MTHYSLDMLLDNLLICDGADFARRHGCTKHEAQAFLTHGTLPSGWQKPRSALFRLAAAVSIAEFTAPTEPIPGTYHDHDHDAAWPAECEVCRGPIRQGFGNFCSDAHRKIMMGEPTMQEQASN